MTVKLAEKKRDIGPRNELPNLLENATGIMRDMNASGAFFWISGDHNIGETITFSIGLKTGGSRMAWMCQGNVVRTETRGTDVGALAKITRTWVESM